MHSRHWPYDGQRACSKASGAEILQRSVYAGYLKPYGLKVLTAVFPNGIIAYLYGPVSAWKNIALRDMTWMNEHLVALQLEIAE